MSIVAVIPARGGSKGIPRKNLARCGGRPLISYTGDASKGSRRLSRVIVSTDDQGIADVCRELGLDAPFLRPSSLANDLSPMVEVLQHALEWFKKIGEDPEALVLLQPTSPLRQAKHIDEAIELFQRSNAPSVVSIVRVPHQFTPGSLLKLNEGRIESFFNIKDQTLRRQDKPVLYARNGPAILVVKPEVLKEGKLYGDPTIGYEMGQIESIDIDSEDDIELVNLILTQTEVKP